MEVKDTARRRKSTCSHVAASAVSTYSFPPEGHNLFHLNTRIAYFMRFVSVVKRLKRTEKYQITFGKSHKGVRDEKSTMINHRSFTHSTTTYHFDEDETSYQKK
jgi:hypothetical protein